MTSIRNAQRSLEDEIGGFEQDTIAYVMSIEDLVARLDHLTEVSTGGPDSDKKVASDIAPAALENVQVAQGLWKRVRDSVQDLNGAMQEISKYLDKVEKQFGRLPRVGSQYGPL